MLYRNWAIYTNVYIPLIKNKAVKKYLHQVKQKEKPLFIHINRTAGSSIANSLGITEIHLTLSDYENLYQKQFDEVLPEDIEIWTSIRNPYDKVVSQYYYRKKTNQNDILKKSISFNTWIKKAFNEKDSKFRDREIMFQQQVDWLSTNRNYTINYIRFENLKSDYKTLRDRFNGKPLVWKKKSEHKNYLALISKEEKQIIDREFKDDFEKFNYFF